MSPSSGTHTHTHTHTQTKCTLSHNTILVHILSLSLCSLEGELRQLDATLASLRQQLSEARGSLSHLEESRLTLEKDINCKTHSLFIERGKCMTQRKRYPAVSTLSGY